MRKWSDPAYINSKLPKEVKVEEPVPLDFTKDTIHCFVDELYGKWYTSCRSMIKMQKSNHPERKKLWPKPTFKVDQNTLKTRRKEAMLFKYGVDHNSKLPHIKKSLSENNPMYDKEAKAKLVETCMRKYGVSNGGASVDSKLKIVASIAQNAENKTSGLESEFRTWIQSIEPTAKSGFIGGANPKQLDVKINKLNLAIELNGTYWHSENFVHKNYHKDKLEACVLNGLRCIQIWDYEWSAKKKQVKSFIKSKLQANIKIPARQCIIKEVDKQVAVSFLDDFHILGSCSFSSAYGLYYKDELVSLVAFGSHHRTGEKNLLKRYIVKEGITVVGGLSKLSTHLKRLYDTVYTFIDLRMSDGASWLACGWSVVSQTNPDYFYYNTKTGKIVSKQSRRKKLVNTPQGMSESEHARLDGLLKVYDCGKLKLILK